MFTIKRSEDNPILSPLKEHPWEAAAAFNWAPVKDGKLTHVVYRAMSEPQLLSEPHIRLSVIGRATTKDGLHFTDRLPFITPEHDFEKYGCEDPRVTEIDGTYYIFYTALSTYPFGADGIKIAVAISDDMKTIREKHLVTPWNAKAMTLFPQKINGKYAALLTVNSDLPPSEIAYVEAERIEDFWSPDFWHQWKEKLSEHTIPFRRSDNDQVEIGGQPIETDAGWLIIYSHIQHYRNGTPTFGIEALLLDKKNPRMILGRTKGAIMVAETYYEAAGFVPNVIFPSGALLTGDNLEIYYGAADTHCAKASLSLDLLLKTITPGAKKPFTRYAGNPIISPRPGVSWEGHGTFNPAAIDLDGSVHILYRAMSDDDTSTFGYASSKNGLLIDHRGDMPVYSPRADFEKKYHPGNSGCEDARIVQIGDKLLMTYTAYDGSLPRVALSSITTAQFLAQKWDAWSTPVIISPPNIDNKDSVVVPEEINGSYYVLHRVSNSICADTINSIDFSTEKINKCIEILGPRHGMWDSRKVGIASPPIKTKRGWLLLYHGVSDTGTYRVGAALLDLVHPTVVLARTALPIFEPEEDYEMKGVVPKVVFPCGAVVRGTTLFIYYGGADAVVGVATAKMSTIMTMLTD
jgi:predicted GH43/DUF377 family glycosyl hydrolase